MYAVYKGEKMKESELERILVDEVRREGGRAYKWISPGNIGVPDRIIFFPDGTVYFVELKTDGGTVRAQQKIQIQRLESLGQDVRVVRGMSGLIKFFRDIGRGHVSDRLEKKRGGEA